jgi:hypothetical protein
VVCLSLTLQFVLHHGIYASAEFQGNGDGVGVAGHVDEVNVHFYISLALEVAVRLKVHERGHCLILWAEGRYEFRGEISPVGEGHDSSPHFLSYYTFGKCRHTSGLEEREFPVYA